MLMVYVSKETAQWLLDRVQAAGDTTDMPKEAVELADALRKALAAAAR